MTLPISYASPLHLPFNRHCLAGRLQLAAPDADPGGPGSWLMIQGGDLLVGGPLEQPYLPGVELALTDGLYLGLWDGRPCRLVRRSREAPLPAGLRAESLLAAEPALPIDLLSLGGAGANDSALGTPQPPLSGLRRRP